VKEAGLELESYEGERLMMAMRNVEDIYEEAWDKM